jgi:hypothetical protein
MNKITQDLKRKGVKEELTYVNSNGKISKRFTYKGMIIKWDNFILNGKFYYWRASFYASLEACVNGIERHINHFKK